MYNFGEKPTVILCTNIIHHVGTPKRFQYILRGLKFFRALHGKFTAVFPAVRLTMVYRGRELPYTVPFENRTIFGKPYHFYHIPFLYRSIFRKPYKYVLYTVLNRGILQQPYTVPYTYHGHKQKSTAVILPQ